MKHQVKVWDLPTRIFHWILVVGVLFMWFSANEGGAWLAWHLRVGLALLALVAFRIVWGFVGSDTARFRQFVKGPSQIKRYLRNEISENEQPGHNPLGALMVVAMLLALLFQVASGLFAVDANSYLYNGYLQHLVSEEEGSAARFVHVNFFWILVGMIALHVLAVLAYRFLKNNNLIKPMITGKKTLEEPLPALRFASPVKAAVIFAVLAVLAYLISLA
ncbi:MAG: cytochrome b/b6 domain-containing protein [Neisseria sp.]|nr:cytochrome b/b6 domain-containing protein [Neisseria sp.]